MWNKGKIDTDTVDFIALLLLAAAIGIGAGVGSCYSRSIRSLCRSSRRGGGGIRNPVLTLSFLPFWEIKTLLAVCTTLKANERFAHIRKSTRHRDGGVL